MHPVSLALTISLATCGWDGGHGLIRRQALAWLPAWQVELLGEAGPRLASDYLALQDQAGAGRPDLEPYVTVPGGPISLHDPCPPARAGAAFGSYLQRVREAIRAGETDEAARYLGVLCHWLEDVGSMSLHCTEGFVNEAALRELIPPPGDQRRRHYLYAANGISDTGRQVLPEGVTHTPVLLGRTMAEAALHLQRRQRLQARAARQTIVPLVMDEMHGDGAEAARLRGELLIAAARTSADAIFTALCLATDRLEGDAAHLDAIALTDFVDDYRGGSTSAPYRWVPFLIDAGFDRGRNVVPLAVPGGDAPRTFARGIGMGAPFALSWSFGPAGVLRRLTATVGLHPDAEPTARVIFVVRANEVELARVGPIAAGEPGQELTATLPAEGDALTLTLATELPEGTDGAGCLAVWGEPTLSP